MSAPDCLHVVLGATGGVGGAVATELARSGRLVRGVSRSGGAVVPGVEGYAADVRDPAALLAALRGAGVVHHCAQPAYTRWPEEFPALTAGIVDAVAQVGARLVVADNLYAYGPRPGGWGPGTPSGPMTERSPALARGRKGRVRAAMTEHLLAAHAAGRLRVSVARLADYYGPGGLTSSFGEAMFEAVRVGRTPVWLGSADQPHSVSYLPDAARAMIALADDPTADGRVWHVPNAPATSARDFVGLVQDVAGAPRRLRVVPVWVVRAAGLVQPMARELAELAYQVQAPFVADHAAYERHFGSFGPTPPRQAAEETLRWFADRDAGLVETA